MQFSQAQTIVDFFENHGLLTAAKIAHFNTGFIEEKSSYQIYPQGIILDLHYDLGFNTILFIYTEDGIFTETKVVHDTHWYPAFDMAAKLVALENTNTENVKDPVQKEVRRFYERRWNKPTNAFSKEELSTSLLYYAWINYIHRTKNNASNTNIQLIEESESNRAGTIDGIKIVGNKTFYDRVEEGLASLKKYVPEIYKHYFIEGPNQNTTVREIRLNTEDRNTIDGEHTILIAKKYGNSYEWSSKFEIATILIHEMKHLDQQKIFELNKILKLGIGEYSKEHWVETPYELAQVEINAYNFERVYLDRLDDSNQYKKRGIANVEKKIVRYTRLAELDQWLANPDHPRDLTCKKLNEFFNGADRHLEKRLNLLWNTYCNNK